MAIQQQDAQREEILRLNHQPLPDTPVRAGTLCPACGNGELDYNGLPDLECPLCHTQISAGAGCT
ncbi:MAG: hypothetical protein ABIJ39_05810 [Chloroflexota bacterium]